MRSGRRSSRDVHVLSDAPLSLAAGHLVLLITCLSVGVINDPLLSSRAPSCVP